MQLSAKSERSLRCTKQTMHSFRKFWRIFSRWLYSFECTRFLREMDASRLKLNLERFTPRSFFVEFNKKNELNKRVSLSIKSTRFVPKLMRTFWETCTRTNVKSFYFSYSYAESRSLQFWKIATILGNLRCSLFRYSRTLDWILASWSVVKLFLFGDTDVKRKECFRSPKPLLSRNFWLRAVAVTFVFGEQRRTLFHYL